MLKINRENLRNSNETPWLILDLIMLGLLLLNLIWLLFDGLYSTQLVQQTLNTLLPGFTNAYDPIHENFILVDLVFIGIFLSEFVLRWIVAIVRKEHIRWYFFPFLRWYDLVGCIPLGATRIFRFLRIFSILYRLHKHEIIDLNQTAIYRFVAFYADVLVEELSDRIVVKVLSDAQKDIASGSPLMDDIGQQVLAPRRAIVTGWMANMLNHIGESIRDGEHGEIIRQHVRHSVGKAVRNNEQVGTLTFLPVVGKTIENTLEQAVTGIVTDSIINLLSDLEASDIDAFIQHGLNDFSPAEEALDQEMLSVVNECIELLKAHVSQQRWKSHLLDHAAEKAEQQADKEPVSESKS